jgi:hypothetical protein
MNGAVENRGIGTKEVADINRRFPDRQVWIACKRTKLALKSTPLLVRVHYAGIVQLSKICFKRLPASS